MVTRKVLYAAAAGGLFILGSSNGLLFNPKPVATASRGVTMESTAAANVAGAVVSPTEATK
jgi:hypothetical protein